LSVSRVLKYLIEKQSGKGIKILHTNNGGEYVNKYVQHLCVEEGIELQHTVPYTPLKNRVAEWKNKSLKEMENCMLQSKSLTPNIWDEAINYVAYIQNQVPHK
jgi:transposase InsO family protein